MMSAEFGTRSAELGKAFESRTQYGSVLKSRVKNGEYEK
jgi:hypothetical protein